MIGERTGNVYRIGDEITVKVVDVNKDERNIDFEIVGMKGTRRPRETTGDRRKRGRPARKRVLNSNTPASPPKSEEKGGMVYKTEEEKEKTGFPKRAETKTQKRRSKCEKQMGQNALFAFFRKPHFHCRGTLHLLK